MKDFSMASASRRLRIFSFYAMGLAVAMGSLAACTQTISTHGQVILPSRLAQVQPGVSTKTDVQRLLGSPSTTSTFSEDRWYYMTSTLKDKPLNPDILKKREVIIIQFDPSGTVAGIDRKTEADGKQIEPDDHITATQGQSLGIVDSMLQSVAGGLGGAK